MWKSHSISLANAHSSTSGSNQLYVFDNATNCIQNVLAASASDNTIRLFDLNTLNQIGQLQGHSDTINEIRFAHTHPDVLFSCSNDSTLRLWDVRTGMQGPMYQGVAEFWSFGIESHDSLLASGNRGDVVFWDVRSTNLVRRLEDMHTDDITQVRFHPLHSEWVFSASVDGTICVFDVNQPDEDEAMLAAINEDDSINRLFFAGPQYEYVSCLTGSERFDVWSVEGSKALEFGDKRAELSTPAFPVNYLISCNYNAITNQLFLIAGNHEGQIGIILVNNNQLQLQSVLNEGHKETVRSYQWNFENNTIITTGEDSRICIWTPHFL